MSRGLINSGFEVVASLPTTDLFEGRQVLYQNRVWVYSNGWVSPNNPMKFPSGVTLQSSTEDLTAAARYVELRNFQLEQIPELLNKSLFISNNDNCVKQSDRLYELIDNETGTITVQSGIVNPVLGQTLRYTAINPSYGLRGLYDRVSRNGNMYYAAYCVYIPQNVRFEKAIYKIEYYIYTDATGDGDINNRDNYVWKTVFEKELQQFTELIYPIGCVPNRPNSAKYSYLYNIRVSVTPTTKNHEYNIDIQDIDIKYFGLAHKSLIYANRLMNYDAVIEPTQTGEVFKSIPWILQYLVQGVNWLKANKFSGSYNDLTNTPNLATVATSGSYNDLTNTPTQLPNPNPITIKTAADGVRVIYDGSASGAVILEAGDNATVTATQDSDDVMTVKFDAVVPQTLPNPNALKITVLDSTGALLGLPMVYDGVDAKYLKLTEGYGIQLSNTNLNNSHEVTINLKQIAGTTLLGNANDTIGIPQAVTMAQLRTMLGSLTLNDTAVTLGGNNSYTLPCYISVGGTLYQARITNNWLQIYRAGEWANAFYLLTYQPTECRYITDLSDPSWYDESVTEYELDNSATDQLLRVNSPVNLADLLEAIGAHQITFNSSVIPSKQFNKGALDNIINNLKGKGYSVFVENDIDTILGSGNDWFMSIKIKKVGNPYKAIIECYVAR